MFHDETQTANAKFIVQQLDYLADPAIYKKNDEIVKVLTNEYIPKLDKDENLFKETIKLIKELR